MTAKQNSSGDRNQGRTLWSLDADGGDEDGGLD